MWRSGHLALRGRAAYAWLGASVWLALALLVLASAPAPATADGKPLGEQLRGSWSFVSSVILRKDGTTVDRWGAEATGIFILDGKGHFTQMITRPDSRLFGAKVVASFGTYTIDEANKAIVTTIEGSTHPRLVGVVQRRSILSLTADEWKYVNHTTASGNSIEAVWKRFK
jgi:hypothetical protein